MKRTCLALASFLLVSVPMAATAGEKEKEKKTPEYIQQKYDRRVEEMRTFDKNKDGILQVEELKASSARKFKAVDTNGDGIITEEEREVSLGVFKTKMTESYNKPLADSQANRIKNRYKNADTNKDGKVSAEEYQTYMNNHQANFDRNGDGMISIEEYRMDGEKLPSAYRQKQKQD
ncbi:MAG: hypothetical protein DI586_07675 [Micavibrio aeruginosavorus]|jgi:Ca2+-binding EF-hand superfamily protein|uniref:EF-hand domain-containing protein n=1 Tax=Micavibrio aeruginosavorus TaxID=349221 RepID=A0A2W5FIU8_9BACT|nr:MAG: hypothetical protein DI586_07675 [Micavibrio aeruginosavorus]